MTGRLGIAWPVIMDADHKIWEAYGTGCRPSMNLIDKQGRIRFLQEGEGEYTKIERAIQSLIQEIDPSLHMDGRHHPLREEEVPGAPCTPTIPEHHVDSIERYDTLSHEPMPMQQPVVYSTNKISLQGDWAHEHDEVTLMSGEGTISLQYCAARCYAIISPNPSSVSFVHNERDPALISIEQDGNPLSPECLGEDIRMIDETTHLLIDMPRLYHLIDNPTVEVHTLRLHLKTPGITFYAFSFGPLGSNEDIVPKLTVKE